MRQASSSPRISRVIMFASWQATTPTRGAIRPAPGTVYVTLFLSADTRGSAIAGLLWLVVFGGYCLLHERFQNRDLKAALGK